MNFIVQPDLYRKRYVPHETVPLSDDVILKFEDKLIVTKWNTLKPRHDIAHGISAYITGKGYKVSKIFDHDNNFVYWYCDIIRTIRYPGGSKIIFEDLLLDVIIYEDGHNEIMDLAELVIAHQSGLVNHDIFCEALKKLDVLLNDIYNGEIQNIFDLLNSFE